MKAEPTFVSNFFESNSGAAVFRLGFECRVGLFALGKEVRFLVIDIEHTRRKGERIFVAILPGDTVRTGNILDLHLKDGRFLFLYPITQSARFKRRKYCRRDREARDQSLFQHKVSPYQILFSAVRDKASVAISVRSIPLSPAVIPVDRCGIN